MPPGRVVIVTGGSQNIGAAISARFLREDDRVICADLNPPEHSESAGLENVHFIETNVAEEASVSALMAEVSAEFGHLDVLVNNAGICLEKIPLWKTGTVSWRSMSGAPFL